MLINYVIIMSASCQAVIGFSHDPVTDYNNAVLYSHFLLMRHSLEIVETSLSYLN